MKLLLEKNATFVDTTVEYTPKTKMQELLDESDWPAWINEDLQSLFFSKTSQSSLAYHFRHKTLWNLQYCLEEAFIWRANVENMQTFESKEENLKNLKNIVTDETRFPMTVGEWNDLLISMMQKFRSREYEKQRKDLVKLLLETKNCSPTVKNSNGYSAFFLATLNNDWEILNTFREHIRFSQDPDLLSQMYAIIHEMEKSEKFSMENKTFQRISMIRKQLAKFDMCLNPLQLYESLLALSADLASFAKELLLYSEYGINGSQFAEMVAKDNLQYEPFFVYDEPTRMQLQTYVQSGNIGVLQPLSQASTIVALTNPVLFKPLQNKPKAIDAICEACDNDVDGLRLLDYKNLKEIEESHDNNLGLLNFKYNPPRPTISTQIFMQKISEEFGNDTICHGNLDGHVWDSLTQQMPFKMHLNYEKSNEESEHNKTSSEKGNTVETKHDEENSHSDSNKDLKKTHDESSRQGQSENLLDKNRSAKNSSAYGNSRNNASSDRTSFGCGFGYRDFGFNANMSNSNSSQWSESRYNKDRDNGAQALTEHASEEYAKSLKNKKHNLKEYSKNDANKLSNSDYNSFHNNKNNETNRQLKNSRANEVSMEISKQVMECRHCKKHRTITSQNNALARNNQNLLNFDF